MRRPFSGGLPRQMALFFLLTEGVWLWRDRRRESVSAPVPAAPDPKAETLESILQAIAALDEAHEAGAIDEGEYQERRDRLRDLAVTLMMAQDRHQSG